MEYLLCEISNDDTIKVIFKNVTEQQVKEKCTWFSDRYLNKNLILIPFKTVEVNSKNYGNDIEVKIE